MTPFYFGCWSADEKGHYLFAAGRDRFPTYNSPLPFDHLDGIIKYFGFSQSEAVLWHLCGYSVLTIPVDCSADKRPASNASFIVEGTVQSFQAMLDAFKLHFPHQFERINLVAPIREKQSMRSESAK
jgi:hypothetical protein